MELREVIKLHYVDFSEMVDPVSLASKLTSLTSYDRDVIQRRTICHGRFYGVQTLYDAIIGKVEWPELCAALRKENLKNLLKILEEEYHRQNPNAQPCLQDENLKPGINHSEEEPTVSSTDDNINDRAYPRMNFTAAASSNTNTSSSRVKHEKGSTTVLIITQFANIQCGNNNSIRTSSHSQNGDSNLQEECEEGYVVCVEHDSSKVLDKEKSEENLLNNNSPDTVLYSRVPNNTTGPENVSPQLSSSSSDSQDDGSPKTYGHNETAEHTARKLPYQEGNGNKTVCLAPGDNNSSHETTNTVPQSHGHVETGDRFWAEKLAISLRTENEGRKEGEEQVNEEEEETELKKCIKPKNESWKKGRKVRGIPGPPGPQGPPGPPGTKGNDGLPGLVVFPDAAAMFGVSIEGLIAYRKDVKQLFVRDHLTWRPIRVAKCGDGIVDRDAGEQCDDGNDDIHDDCLGCRRSSCGDGIRNRRTEECDGRDLGDKTCATYREGMTGPLTCTPVCQISYQRCRHKRYLRR